ncbi:MAG: preprotein translocase subunit YajC [Frankiaceae bacterium]
MHTGLAALVAAGSSGSGGYSLLFFIVIIAGMFWFMSRAQRRSRQRVQDVQSRLLPGQEVMTGAGIYGRIVDTMDDRVRIEIAPGVVVTLAKQAIVRTVDEPGTITDAPPATGIDAAAERPYADGTGATRNPGDSRETTIAD